VTGVPAGMEMKPIPETREAIDELEPLADDHLLDRLLAAGRQVNELVPDCVGLSLATAEHGVTFALVASEPDIARTAEMARRELPQDPEIADFTSEHDWRLVAETTAAPGVRSTLTLPILTNGEVSGSVNLYAASPRAFTGLQDNIAKIFDAWAPGAVSNADLSFSSRAQAAQAPGHLRAAARISTAVGIIAGILGLDLETAARALRDAAACAGVDELRVAEALLHARSAALPPPRST
jgi:GAF domain-containing protein